MTVLTCAEQNVSCTMVSTNMICARVGYADRDILVRLFKSYCSSLYGCELWNTSVHKKAFNELCVAYHSCIKRLVKLPRSTRNHDMCLALELLPCPMLVACRQLSFWRRLHSCDNSIVRALLASGIDAHGLLATTHMEIRRSYDLLGLNLHAVSGRDLTNMFVGRLERFVRTRNEMADKRV